jgi:serine/threonine protein kinase
MWYNDNGSSELINYEDYDTEMKKFAIPFDIPKNIDVDAPLTAPKTRSALTASYKVKNCKKLKKNIFIIKSEDIYNFIEDTTHHYNRIKNDILDTPCFFRAFSNGITTQKYIVKVVNVCSYRFMLTSLKEAIFQNKVYNSTYKQYRGRDIVPRTLMCSPVWTGKKWQFIIVSEFVEGVSLHTMRGVINKIINPYHRSDVIRQIRKSVETLWMLGYSHNDLSDYNVVYDKVKNTARIIDFESCVALPDDLVVKFRKAMTNNVGNNPADLYIMHYKYPALSILTLSEAELCTFVASNRIIQNTDDFFLNYSKVVL